MGIPIVDIKKLTGVLYSSESVWNDVAIEFKNALKNIGFVYISGHGIDQNKVIIFSIYI